MEESKSSSIVDNEDFDRIIFRGDAFGERGVKQLKKFRKFVDKTDKIINEHLNAWILVALKFNVQDLSIHIEGDENGRYDLQIRLPHSLFNSHSLSSWLKVMSLCSFHVEDGDSINKLISSCPILESLILRDVWIEDGYEMNVNIESDELKHSEIINNNLLVWSHYNLAKIIKLSAPNLTSFICKDYMLQEYRLENVSSLVTADIEIVREDEYEAFEYYALEISEEEKEILYPKRMMEFMKAFHNVKELTISSPGLLQLKNSCVICGAAILQLLKIRHRYQLPRPSSLLLDSVILRYVASMVIQHYHFGDISKSLKRFVYAFSLNCSQYGSGRERWPL
ncbi:hypothetical protein MKW92_028617 [Papaver armeniacum]|nr:hypothetical protein MKW92_028617 [Papaver armeniacum]